MPEARSSALTLAAPLMAVALVAGAFLLGYRQDGLGRAFEAALRALVVLSLLSGTVASYRASRQRR